MSDTWRLVSSPSSSRMALISFIVLGISALLIPAQAQPCHEPDSGGTVDLPPAGCGYVSPADLHQIINGLPPGTTINISAKHDRFFGVVRAPGGSLGGEVETFDSFLTLTMTGTGALAGFNRVLMQQGLVETHVAPRAPGFPVQSFDTDMFRLQSQLPPGDPDFDLLRITAGTGFGLPSPGHTTLTRLPGGDWNVDSFFDITYRIDFVGAPGGALAGMSGSTTGTLRMGAGGPPQCAVPDDGTGTVKLPPANCGYVSPADVHRIIDGLPAGTTIEVGAEHFEFLNIVRMPGGSLGGEKETFDSQLRLHLDGTGALAGFTRDLSLMVQAETHVGPRTPGDPVQDFDTDMFRLQGQLPPGDPDFDLLRITAGTDFGLPSPGHTTLTQLAIGVWTVDSFFDITYRIDFVGAPGGPLGGMSGSTTGPIRMQTGDPPPPCPPIPGGTDMFPSSGKLVIQDVLGNMHVVRLDSMGMGTSAVDRGMQSGDTIPIELLALSLHSSIPGPLPTAPPIPIQVYESPTLSSLGKIQNIVQDPGAGCGLSEADSFFDVFFEVYVGDPTDAAPDEVWFNSVPINIRSRIDQLPPRSPYENPFVQPVQLFDRASGAPRGAVFYELHHPDPPVPPGGNDCFDTMLANRIFLYGPGYVNTMMSQGPTLVRRSDPGMLPTGQPVLDTEMLQMDLRGSDPFLGPFSIAVRPTPPGPPSKGQAVGQAPPGPPYPLDSFFDVFVDIQGPGFPPMTTAGPVNIRSLLGSVPPPFGTRFQSPPGTPTQIVDAGSGIPVGEIADIDHKLGTYRSWLPPPPGGDDCFDSWLTLRIDVFPTGCSETVMLQGPTRVLRGNPSDPGDGHDVIQSLMAKLRLSGASACLGQLMVVLDPASPAAGSLRSLAPAENFPMDSFFDVWPILDTALYGRVTVGGATHMGTTVNDVPPDPGEIYYGPGTVLPIFDSSGALIGQITEVEHKVHRRIECPCDCLPIIDFDAAGCITLGGGGAHYDIARGPVVFPPEPAQWQASFVGAACLQDNGPPVLCDPATPAPGKALWYLARDGYDTGQANYKDCEVPPVDPDLFLTSCPR